MRIKMSPYFGHEPKKEKSAWDLRVEEQDAERNPNLSVPHVFTLSFENGGNISAHKTRDGAYAKGAQLIMKGYMINDLRGIDEQFTHDECDCNCHNTCECDCGGEHDPDTEDCFFEDCSTDDDDCCHEHFEGKEVAVQLEEMFRQERYMALVMEWNSFWSNLSDYRESEDGERADGFILDVKYQVILS